MNIKVHSSFILPYIWEAECPSFCYPVHIVVCYRHYGVIVILSNRGLSVIAHITFEHLYSKPAIPLTKWRACKSARTGVTAPSIHTHYIKDWSRQQGVNNTQKRGVNTVVSSELTTINKSSCAANTNKKRLWQKVHYFLLLPRRSRESSRRCPE